VAQGGLVRGTVGGVNFGALDEYLAKLAELGRSAGIEILGDFSHKHVRDEEEERLESRKAEADEEKKRKAGSSRGVRDLKKVNHSGMMKLSHFFQEIGWSMQVHSWYLSIYDCTATKPDMVWS